jgi:hypothetical protein
MPHQRQTRVKFALGLGLLLALWLAVAAGLPEEAGDLLGSIFAE